MKVAIIGVAHMHAHSYVQEFQDRKIEVVGVYDRDLTLSQAFGKEYNLPVFEDLETLLAVPSDSVNICSENAFHKDYALKAFAYGKHVIVEKPMALSTADAEAMIEAGKAANRLLIVAHPVRFSEPIQNLKTVIDRGELGKLKLINSSNHGKNPGGWFIDPELSGGGALIDHTVHICDLVNYLFGIDPKAIFAYAGKSQPDLPVEDIGLIQLTMTEGVIMSLDTSWNRPETYPVWGDAILELVFEKGQMTVDGFGRKLKVFNDVTGTVEEFFFEESMDSRMIDAFIQAIEAGTTSPVSGEDGLYTVQITEAAFQSAMTKKLVTL
ncbi:Gfo/Idh/MocA family protein [Enterococcus sp. LJL98]